MKDAYWKGFFFGFLKGIGWNAEEAGMVCTLVMGL